MKWIKKGLKLLVNYSGEEQREFEKYNSLMVLTRIQLISLAAIFLSVFWVCVDWTIIKNGADKIYSQTLITMHIISIAASAGFLFFYNRITDRGKIKNYRILYISLKTYVFLYILFGAAASINSQRYNGNIYSYIILSLIAAIAFTLKPSFMFFAFGINHLLFLAGIAVLCEDSDGFLAKLINATVLSGAAFLISFIFYRHRMMEFFYRKKLLEDASIDDLTGILNRKTGLKRLEELIEESKEGFLEFVLCFLDINNLKNVNDTYGHSEGDRYILAICNMIKNILREEDIFFRMGGDEFIIVFRDKDKFQAEHIWKNFMKQFDIKNLQGEFTYNIMASHGLFYYCTGMDTDLMQIIEKADKQMYKEKQRFKKEQ